MKKQLLKIFAHPHENTGVGFYRIIQPLKWIGRQKLAFVNAIAFTGDMIPQNVDIKDYEKNAGWADIIYTTAAKTQAQCAYFMAARDHYHLRLVVDIDDNLTQLNPDHPNKDKLTKSDSAYWAQRSMEYADLMVTTNPYLAKLYETVNRNTFINPNSIDFDIWGKEKVKPNKKTRIGWAGASGHQDDLKILTKVIPTIKKRYKNLVEIISIGEKPRAFEADKDIGWLNMMDYPREYQKVNFDIVLAPMKDTAYNRGKSNLRLLEAGSLSKAIIASPVGEYRDFPCLKAKETEEWIESISILIEDKKLREKLGKEAFEEVKKKYDIKVTAPKLLKRLDKLMEETWKGRKWKT